MTWPTVLRKEINMAIGGFNKKQKAAVIKAVKLPILQTGQKSSEAVTLKAQWLLFVPPV